jgi:hypothetical protein
LKEFYLDEHAKGITGEEMDKKYSIWSEVVKSKKKFDTDLRQTGLKPIQVTVNQGVTQEIVKVSRRRDMM